MRLPPGIHKNETTDAHGYTLIKTEQTGRKPNAQSAQKHSGKRSTAALRIATRSSKLSRFSWIDPCLPCTSMVPLLLLYFKTSRVAGGAVQGRSVCRRVLARRGRAGCGRAGRVASNTVRKFPRWHLPLH